MGYKEIILAVLFIFLWRSGCVFWGRNEFEVNSWAIMRTVRDSDLGIFLTWNGISKSVWVFGDECVLDVSSANTVSTCQSTTNHTCKRHALCQLTKVRCGFKPRSTYTPSKTNVFLLNAGNFTTSSYVTRSSWSNTKKKTQDCYLIAGRDWSSISKTECIRLQQTSCFKVKKQMWNLTKEKGDVLG